MDTFLFYLKVGINHIIDLNAYDHLLFLSSISLPYTFKRYYSLFWIVTFFTIGHTVSLFISTYNIYNPNLDVIEFLIPLTILFSAVSNLIPKMEIKKTSFNHFISLIFGLIHGFGFAGFYDQITFSDQIEFTPLIGFTLGVEIAQIIIVVFVLFFSSMFQSKRNFFTKNFTKIMSILICLLTILIFF